MPIRLLIVSCCIFGVATITVPAHAQQTSPSSANSVPNAPSSNNSTIEGTVVSTSQTTLVARSDDNQYHLFTYDGNAASGQRVTPGERVRVVAGPPDENGTREASNITVLNGAQQSNVVDKSAQAAPLPPKVRQIESNVENETKRWHMGVMAGAAFDPELFSFGVLSQLGPIFSPHVLFRPSAEFAFGEVTDLISLNFEPIYRLPGFHTGRWHPYLGGGPAMIFINQSYSKGHSISFGNFDYETGFNILAGVQSRRGTFFELKTSLWSGPAPKLRLIVGYSF